MYIYIYISNNTSLGLSKIAFKPLKKACCWCRTLWRSPLDNAKLRIWPTKKLWNKVIWGWFPMPYTNRHSSEEKREGKREVVRIYPATGGFWPTNNLGLNQQQQQVGLPKPHFRCHFLPIEHSFFAPVGIYIHFEAEHGHLRVLIQWIGLCHGFVEKITRLWDHTNHTFRECLIWLSDS